MRYATDPWVPALTSAAVGVFAFIGGDGFPRSCAVTPYVVDDVPVVTSTLALVAKMQAVRRDPRVALLAGGVLARGRGEVVLDLSSGTFDSDLREQELRKYPPARSLLAIPGHRRLLWWYVGRAVLRIPAPEWRSQPGCDRVTLTVIGEDGLPTIRPLPDGTDVHTDVIAVPGDLPDDGPASLLVHEEDERMGDLRQLTLRGHLRARQLHVVRRSGSLEPTDTGIAAQLRGLTALRAAAIRNRPALHRWVKQQEEQHDD